MYSYTILLWRLLNFSIEKRFVEVFVQYALIVITTIELFT